MLHTMEPLRAVPTRPGVEPGVLVVNDHARFPVEIGDMLFAECLLDELLRKVKWSFIVWMSEHKLSLTVVELDHVAAASSVTAVARMKHNDSHLRNLRTPVFVSAASFFSSHSI